MATKTRVPKKVRRILDLARRIVDDPSGRPRLVGELARIYRGLDREDRTVLFPEIVRKLELPPEELRRTLEQALEELERDPTGVPSARWPASTWATAPRWRAGTSGSRPAPRRGAWRSRAA